MLHCMLCDDTDLLFVLLLDIPLNVLVIYWFLLCLPGVIFTDKKILTDVTVIGK
jgi:hypothetical protein